MSYGFRFITVLTVRGNPLLYLNCFTLVWLYGSFVSTVVLFSLLTFLPRVRASVGVRLYLNLVVVLRIKISAKIQNNIIQTASSPFNHAEEAAILKPFKLIAF